MAGKPVTETGRVFALFIARGRRLLSLKMGDLVKAEVLNITPAKDAAIRLNNRVIKVKTEVPLKKGERLLLRVEGEGDRIQLRLVDDRSLKSQDSIKKMMLSALKGLKSPRPGLSELKELKTFLDMIPDSVKEKLPGLQALKRFFISVEGLSGNTLKSLLESSGILFETKLKMLTLKALIGDGLLQEGVEGPSQGSAGQGKGELQQKVFNSHFFSKGLGEVIKCDLKGGLLSLKKSLKDQWIIDNLMRNNLNRDKISAAIGAIDKLLRNIEYYQLHSRFEGVLHLFIPLLWERLSEGELIFRESHKGTGKGKVYYCIIRLELKRIGRMVIWVFMQSGNFHVRFVAENTESLELMQRYANLLEEQFMASGLNLGSLRLEYKERIDLDETIPEGLDIKI